MNEKITYFTTLLTILFTSYSCSSSAPGTGQLNSVSTSSTDSSEKTLLSIYMVGGNLEDDVKPRNGIPDEKEKGSISTAGAGSNDLRELIDGYENLSQNQKNNLDIVVAFGGARKEGWTGVKYADMPCIIKDSQDRYFGNDSCYMYKEQNANMAKQSSLETYLKFIKNKYGNHPKKVMDLWDHGFAYLGMGQDSVNGNDLINLKELKTSFENSGLKFNLLSFDACLMGSIEVAKTVKEFADYMVASEELEPAHGWNYTDFVNILSKNNSFEVIGKKLVDSYIDSPEHKDEFSKYKTLSLIDLKKLDTAIQSLDTFSSSLNMQNFSKLLSAVEESQKFGDAGKSNLSYTIDLINWVTNIKNNYPEASASAQNVLSKLSELVVYSRHDESKPNSNGISIYSLSKNMENKYGTDQTFSKTWLDFSRSFVRFGTNDFTSPVVNEENFSAKSDTSNDCNSNGKTGNCLDISDNLGLKSVEQVFALKTDDRYLFMIGSNQLKSKDESRKYFAPVWDGEWFLLCDGDCKTGLSIFPPAYFNSSTESGSSIYSSDAILNGEDVIFYIEVGKNNSVLSQWAVPYTIGDNGEVLLNRNQLKVNIGDTIQFYYQVYDKLNSQVTWKKGESLTFSGTPQFNFARIDADRLYYVHAEDYKGNISNSKIHEVK